MTVENVPWVTRLRPSSDTPLSPVCDPRWVDAMRIKLGDGPVDWAIEAAYSNARAHQRRFPHWGAAESVLPVTDRLAPESGAILMLLTLLEGEPPLEVVTEDARRMIRAFVHRQVRLEELLQAITEGESRLNRMLIEACERFVPQDQQISQAQAIVRLIFEFIERFLTQTVAEYSAELERWTASDVAVRGDLARRVMSEEDLDLTAVSMKLNYQIALRSHRGFVLWANEVNTISSGALQRFAAAEFERRAMSSVLFIPTGHAELWCWASQARADPGHGTMEVELPEGIGMAVGRTYAGREGFRRTHDEALAAQRVARSAQTRADRATCYEDVHLEALLLRDLEAASWFVVSELGDLADPGEPAATLRATLAAYLATRSPVATATQLYIVRNTVAYRLRRIEELLPHPIAKRSAELAVALRLFDLIALADLDDAYRRHRAMLER